MPVFGSLRSGAALAALLMAVGLALLGAAGPAAAKTQRLKTGIYKDKNAKLSMVLQKSKKGKLQRVKSIKVTKYDLNCTLVGDVTQQVVEVDFTFPSIRIERKRKGKYGYVFSGKASEKNPFTEGFYAHGGTAEGYFTTSKKGKPKKLTGFVQMGAYGNQVPGLPGNWVCGDDVRKKPFERVHGFYSTKVR